MTAFSSFALLIITGASANVDSQSYLPITHARFLGMKAIKKAHSRALAGRRIEAGDDMDFDFASMTDEMKNQMQSMICQLFNAGMGQEDLNEEMATEGMVCSDVSCVNSESTGIPTLNMGCNMEGVHCEEEDGEEFCVEDTKIDFSMEINFVGMSNVEATQCGTYTKPDYMAAMGNGCVDIQATVDMAEMMEADALVEAGTMTAEEAEDTGIAIAGCSAAFNDGTSCECESCNEGMGFELKCNNALVSEECTNFDTGVVNMESGSSEAPGVAVFKLVASPGAGEIVTETDTLDGNTDADETGTNDTSPAASRVGGVVAGLTVAFASLQAVM